MYRYIKAMSEERRTIHNRLVDRSDVINEHIIKLLLFPDSSDRDHWKQEIVNALPRIQKMKGTNKFPSASFIQEGLSTFNDSVSSYIRTIEDDYRTLSPVPVGQRDIVRALQWYQSYLAKELSKNGSILRTEAYFILDDIVSTYSKKGGSAQ